jgi:manganese transport protein
LEKSLSEVNSSVKIPGNTTVWRRFLAFSGPAFMVSVGYMDPGNWATDIQGGAQFGYSLLYIILAANLMAILFQSLGAKLGIVTGRDLAQACREHYSKRMNFVMWILSEIAIAACDLAEVLGSAIGLNLLFGIPLLWGVLITTLDVLILMTLVAYGIRKMEAVILVLIGTIGVCFAFEMFLIKPDVAGIAKGFIPNYLSGNALYIALGIIGATVMPHNLYLHSALVQSRAIDKTPKGIKQANRYNLLDSVFALNIAFFVNAAILILAAGTFFKNNMHGVASLVDAHAFLDPILGSSLAPVAFGVALLAAGQSSTITGTFAGQIVMEGHIGVRMRPWLRRFVTRLLAILPAVLVISINGEQAADSLLVISQVVLSLQLPFALIPLLHFTASRKKMGEFASSKIVVILAWISAVIIISLNGKFIGEMIMSDFTSASGGSVLIKYILFPIALILSPLLLYIILEPALRKDAIVRSSIEKTLKFVKHQPVEGNYRKVGIALEGVQGRDDQIIHGILPLLKLFRSDVIFIHCVESAAGRYMGRLVDDLDAKEKREYLLGFVKRFEDEGIKSEIHISGGEPENEIALIAEAEKVDLIVAGSHGHKLISDMIYGSTLTEVRHRVKIPILTIPIKA